jgi:hypothetical protein
LQEVGIEGVNIKMNLKEMGGVFRSECGPVPDCYECGTETSGSIKCREFLE